MQSDRIPKLQSKAWSKKIDRIHGRNPRLFCDESLLSTTAVDGDSKRFFEEKDNAVAKEKRGDGKEELLQNNSIILFYSEVFEKLLFRTAHKRFQTTSPCDTILISNLWQFKSVRKIARLKRKTGSLLMSHCYNLSLPLFTHLWNSEKIQIDSSESKLPVQQYSGLFSLHSLRYPKESPRVPAGLLGLWLC